MRIRAHSGQLQREFQGCVSQPPALSKWGVAFYKAHLEPLRMCIRTDDAERQKGLR